MVLGWVDWIIYLYAWTADVSNILAAQIWLKLYQNGSYLVNQALQNGVICDAL